MVQETEGKNTKQQADWVGKKGWDPAQREGLTPGRSQGHKGSPSGCVQVQVSVCMCAGI